MERRSPTRRIFRPAPLLRSGLKRPRLRVTFPAHSKFPANNMLEINHLRRLSSKTGVAALGGKPDSLAAPVATLHPSPGQHFRSLRRRTRPVPVFKFQIFDLKLGSPPPGGLRYYPLRGVTRRYRCGTRGNGAPVSDPADLWRHRSARRTTAASVPSLKLKTSNENSFLDCQRSCPRSHTDCTHRPSLDSGHWTRPLPPPTVKTIEQFRALSNHANKG
jgi:hypothetical protein